MLPEGSSCPFRGVWPFSEEKIGHVCPKKGQKFFSHIIKIFFKIAVKMTSLAYFFEIWQFFYLLAFLSRFFLSGGGTESGKIDLLVPGTG